MIRHIYDEQRIYSYSAAVGQHDPVPRRSTDVEPPETTGSEVARWTGRRWELLPDRPQPPGPTAGELRQQELQRRTDPERLLSALELVAQATIKSQLSTMDDPDKAVALFPELKPGMAWTKQDIDDIAVVAWEGKLYKVLQPHTAQADWTPENSPSLYTPFRNPAAGPQPWVQPTSAETAYQTGEEVTHPNPNDGGNVWLYRSKIDANTTEPGQDGTFDRWWEPVEAV